MPRRHRIGSAGFIFHVLNRGAFRHRLFSQKADYEAFFHVVAEGLTRYPVRLMAICTMPTHFHMVLRPLVDAALSGFMAWVTTTHAQRWRRAGETVGQGAVYQGRYKAIPIQDGSHLLVALWYVERNPVRARLVDRAERWPWSSASGHGRNYNGLTLAPWSILRPCDWLDRLNSGEPPTGIEELRLAIAKGRPFGEEQWQRETAVRLKLEHTLRSRGEHAATPFLPPVEHLAADSLDFSSLLFDAAGDQDGQEIGGGRAMGSSIVQA